MRTVPPLIRSIGLRDQLSELLKGALQMRYRAAPLYLLRSFGDVVSGQEQAEVSRDALVQAAERAFDAVGIGVAAAEALNELLTAKLLRYVAREGEQARLAPGEALHAELSAATNRVKAYCRVLTQVSRRRSRSLGPVEGALEEAAYLFNEGLFFEVHEVLEAVWLTQGEEARLLLQGLIQIAVGFHHLENNNLRGALSLLQEGVEKVKRYAPDRSGLKLEQFLTQIERAQLSIESLGEAACRLFDRRMIPTMPILGVYRSTPSRVRPVE